MWKLEAVMTSLLLTVLLIATVIGVPIPSNLPTEIIPLGISAPFTCPAEAVGEGTGEESEPCSNLDNELKEGMELSIRPIVRESVMEQMENSLAFVVEKFDEQFTTDSDDPDVVVRSLTGIVREIFEEYEPAIKAADSLDVSNAFIAHIISRNYSCQISRKKLASAIDSYLASNELQTLIDMEIADKSTSDTGIISTLLAGSPATSILPAIQTQFNASVFSLVNDGVINQVISPSIIDMVSDPLNEVPSDIQLVIAIAIINKARNKLTGKFLEQESTFIPDVKQLIGCTICSISKNAIDEVIVKAVTDLLTSAETTGATDADSIATSVSDSVSAEVMENVFSDSVLAGISQGDLRLNVVDLILKNIFPNYINNLYVRKMIDIMTAESVLKPTIETDKLEEALADCVKNYLADPEAIKTAITNAVTNAIVTDGVSPNTVASISIDDIIQELVQSINETMNFVDGTSITSVLNKGISEILSAALYHPDIFEFVTFYDMSDFNDALLNKTLLNKLLLSKVDLNEVLYSANLKELYVAYKSYAQFFLKKGVANALFLPQWLEFLFNIPSEALKFYNSYH